MLHLPAEKVNVIYEAAGVEIRTIDRPGDRARVAAAYGLQKIDGKALAGSQQFYRYYGYYQEDQHFLECVRQGTEPETSIADAVKTFHFVDLLASSLI